MDLKALVREALETQVMDADPGGAARVLESGAREHPLVDLAGILLDTASILLKRMVSETDEAYEAADLLSRLALDGAVPEDRLEELMVTLEFAAATAGGIRPPIEALAGKIGESQLVFGSWLSLLTTLKIVSITLSATEAELVEDLASVLEPF